MIDKKTFEEDEEDGKSKDLDLTNGYWNESYKAWRGLPTNWGRIVPYRPIEPASMIFTCTWNNSMNEKQDNCLDWHEG